MTALRAWALPLQNVSKRRVALVGGKLNNAHILRSLSTWRVNYGYGGHGSPFARAARFTRAARAAPGGQCIEHHTKPSPPGHGGMGPAVWADVPGPAGTPGGPGRERS